MNRTRIRNVGLVALVAALAATSLLSGCGEPSLPDPSIALAQATPAEPAPPATFTTHDTLGARDTLDGALDRAGLDGETRHAAIAALSEHLDVRRLRPGTGIAVTRDEDGGLVSVACRAGIEAYVRADATGPDTFVAHPVEIPTVTEVRTVSTRLESSLYEALVATEHGASLVAQFADIFQWDVDLFTETRRGDGVRIAHEIVRFESAGPDAPRFGTDPVASSARLGRILAAAYEGDLVRADAYWLDGDPEREGGYFDREGRPMRKAFLKSPLNYRRISSRFSRGRMHPILRKVIPHHGVDFAADRGTPVVASGDGRVVSAGWSGALGKAVKIRHPNGYTTIYGHLQGYAKGIRSGAKVRQGAVVGFVGSTGRATGPHLHYTMLRDGRAIDPLKMKNPPVDPLPERWRPMLARTVERWATALEVTPDTRIAEHRTPNAGRS